MGKRTSIYLTASREAAIEASGKTVAELIDLGLEAAGQDELAQTVQPRPDNPRGQGCKHPRARRAKGLCMACGTYVG
jgi:hypothetical protein